MKQEIHNYAAGVAVVPPIGTELSMQEMTKAVRNDALQNEADAEDALLCAVTATPDEAIGQDILTLAGEDPLLASLIKQYLNASRQHKSLMKLHGYHDPMADVAADMVDSAWCAVQTRIIELQAAKRAEGHRGPIVVARPMRAIEEPEANIMPVQSPVKTVQNWPKAQAAPQTPDLTLFLMWLALMVPQMKQQAQNMGRHMTMHAFARAAS